MDDDLFDGIRRRISDMEAERDEAEGCLKTITNELQANKIVLSDGKAYVFIGVDDSGFFCYCTLGCPFCFDDGDGQWHCTLFKNRAECQNRKGRYYSIDEIRGFYSSYKHDGKKLIELGHKVSAICDTMFELQHRIKNVTSEIKDLYEAETGETIH